MLGLTEIFPKSRTRLLAYPFIASWVNWAGFTGRGLSLEEAVSEANSSFHPSSSYLIPSPATGNSEWDSSNANKALKKLYLELAEKLDIPLLGKVLTHVWRTTLNTEWMERGIPGVVRAAYLGHTEEVNKRYYTDLTDIAPLVKMLAESGL